MHDATFSNCRPLNGPADAPGKSVGDREEIEREKSRPPFDGQFFFIVDIIVSRVFQTHNKEHPRVVLRVTSNTSKSLVDEANDNS